MAQKQAAVLPVTYDSLPRIHRLTASCTFWELDPLAQDLASIAPEVDKEAWLTAQCFNQGICGFNIADRNAETRAFATVLFCPAGEAPGAIRMPTSPVSTDAHVVTSLHIDAAAAGRGWESVLLDAAIMSASDKGVPALEAFGVDEAYEGEIDPLFQSFVDRQEEVGLMRKADLESAGFTVVEDHPVLPRLRLDLPPEQSLLSAEEVDYLLDHVAATL